MSFKDHFSGHADDYARFRPGYPGPLFHWLAERVPVTGTVWDCGCGNGQASRQLAPLFSKVYATDASAQQIASAHGPGNVIFSIAAAEHSGLANASVDLICAAQALHWFDVPAFYAEAQRVARPDALLAVWTYGSASVDGISADILDEFEHVVVGPYWPPERIWIDQGYANVDLPGRHCDVQPFEMHAEWPLDSLVGYIGSWSATHRYFAATGHDPLPQLRGRLAREWGDQGSLRLIRWPLFVRAARLRPGSIS